MVIFLVKLLYLLHVQQGATDHLKYVRNQDVTVTRKYIGLVFRA